MKTIIQLTEEIAKLSKTITRLYIAAMLCLLGAFVGALFLLYVILTS